MPQLLHRVWFGSFLPTNYQKNLLQFAQLNSSSTLLLWTDFGTISESEQQQFIEFCQIHHIELHNIQEHPKLTNMALIREELDRAQSEPQHRLLHLVRASDLARIAILIEHGGIYTDTDTVSLNPLPTLSLPFGFLAKYDPITQIELINTLDSIPDFSRILYDFMAAEPQNKILIFAAKISEIDYQTYHNSANKQWELSSDRDIHMSSTIRLTGSALRYAINYLLAHREISVKNPADLFFNDSKYLNSTYDKSWLKGYVEQPDTEENASMELFREEIETERYKSFPYTLPSIRSKEEKYEYCNFSFEFDSATLLNRKKEADIITPDQILQWNLKNFNHIELLKFKFWLPQWIIPEFKLEPITLESIKCNTVEFKLEPSIVETKFMEEALVLLEEYVKSVRSGFFSFWNKGDKIQLDLLKVLIKDIKTKKLTSGNLLISQLNEIDVPPNTPLFELIKKLKLKPEYASIVEDQECISNNNNKL